MSRYVNISYAGATLEIPSWLEPLWPYDMLLEDWPTFCGPGKRFGDIAIPDRIHEAYVNPACFEHDVSLALIKDASGIEFKQVNTRFWGNLRSLVRAQITDSAELRRANWWCGAYYKAVSRFGGQCIEEVHELDPLKNKTVRARLQRLAVASWVNPSEYGVPV